MAKAFDQVHPLFRAALEAAGQAACREGAPSPAEEGEELLEAAEEGTRLQVVVKRGKILRAAHQGAEDPAARAVLDVFCQTIEGLPLQEAADHAGHHMVARLRNGVDTRPVPGILTPWNADPLFHPPIRLLRRILADHRERHGIESLENFWNPTISKDWLRLDEGAQCARLEAMLADFLAEQGLVEGDMQVVGVERNIRVLLAISGDLDYRRKPSLLLAFERKLRAATGDRLEVFAEEMKDDNKLRRL
jgi:hypothetical protein